MEDLRSKLFGVPDLLVPFNDSKVPKSRCCVSVITTGERDRERRIERVRKRERETHREPPKPLFIFPNKDGWKRIKNDIKRVLIGINYKDYEWTWKKKRQKVSKYVLNELFLSTVMDPLDRTPTIYPTEGYFSKSKIWVLTESTLSD